MKYLKILMTQFNEVALICKNRYNDLDREEIVFLSCAIAYFLILGAAVFTLYAPALANYHSAIRLAGAIGDSCVLLFMGWYFISKINQTAAI